MPSMHTLKPFDFVGWIKEHQHLLQPPVGNKVVWEDADMTVMVVGGPNERTDYHDDPMEEFFFMIKGDMVLRVMEEPGQPPKDIKIKQGEVFLLPAHVRHSPQREADSVGLVIEPKRTEGKQDAFEWYCLNCHHLVHRHEFILEDIEKDLPPIFNAFYESKSLRTCIECGELHPGKEIPKGFDDIVDETIETEILSE